MAVAITSRNGCKPALCPAFGVLEADFVGEPTLGGFWLFIDWMDSEWNISVNVLSWKRKQWVLYLETNKLLLIFALMCVEYTIHKQHGNIKTVSRAWEQTTATKNYNHKFTAPQLHYNDSQQHCKQKPNLPIGHWIGGISLSNRLGIRYKILINIMQWGIKGLQNKR